MKFAYLNSKKKKKMWKMTRYVPDLALPDKDSGFYAISGVLSTVVTGIRYNKYSACPCISVTYVVEFCGRESTGAWFKQKNHLKKNIFLIWLSQMFTWVVKKFLNLTFKVIFLCQKSFESFWFFFIEKYQFRSSFSVIDIFWQLQFLKHFIF